MLLNIVVSGLIVTGNSGSMLSVVFSFKGCTRKQKEAADNDTEEIKMLCD
jgi:hypothetical protein